MPAEWTADQLHLWALHREYRAIAEAVATRDGELPDTEILESPPALRRWFDTWLEETKSGNDHDGSRDDGRGEKFQLIIRD